MSTVHFVLAISFLSATASFFSTSSKLSTSFSPSKALISSLVILRKSALALGALTADELD